MSDPLYREPTFLAQKNPHDYDHEIIFQEEQHKYLHSSDQRELRSVTTLIASLFPQFDTDAVIKNMMASKNWPHSKYYGMTAEEIKQGWKNNGEEASNAGTDLHRAIELYWNEQSSPNPLPLWLGQVQQSKEYGYFLKFVKIFSDKFPQYEPYRTEWRIRDLDRRLAGTIDMTFRSKDNGNIIIVDWKRSKEIKYVNPTDRFAEYGYGPVCTWTNCNANKYRLQLNIYKTMLEQCYDMSVEAMYLVNMHQDREDLEIYTIEEYLHAEEIE